VQGRLEALNFKNLERRQASTLVGKGGGDFYHCLKGKMRKFTRNFGGGGVFGRTMTIKSGIEVTPSNWRVIWPVNEYQGK